MLGFSVLAGIVAIGPSAALATTYYVANAGSDQNDGTSPERPWRTLARVNGQALEPGDTVLLRRGDRWREQLLPHSGSEAGAVTYGAYGEGPKPLLLGSMAVNDPAQWVAEGDHIWATTSPKGTGRSVLTEDTLRWSLYCENGAQAAGERDAAVFDSPPASFHVTCAESGKSGSDMQLSLAPFRIELGRTYRLSLRAQSTLRFACSFPVLMKQGRPWGSYTGGAPLPAMELGPEWQTYTHYYRATVTADDARLTIFLGGGLAAGAVLHVDSLSLEECETGNLLCVDVGNIILNGGEACGVKKWLDADLKQQGDFWYDRRGQRVKLYSTEPPTAHYRDIECALYVHQIDESGRCYVTYENLALLYGGAHGIGGGNTHHITVRDCDFGFIGGADQMGGDHRVRFGNGIEFWGNAHDNLVERCRLWEVYDAALTNQNAGAVVEQVNITYRYNVIWNCEYSFEYWNAPEASLTRNIRFEDNTCVNAGHGWGHAQRPDPSGRHLCFYSSPAAASGITIRNNVFYEAAGNAFYAPTWPAEGLTALDMDHNLWHQAQGVMASLEDHPYTMADFAKYQAEQGKDVHSMVADPLFVDLPNHDFHLTANSPCVDAGMDVGAKADFEGTPVPQGKAPDIGAYECRSR